jgi:hypothetical protein
MAITNIRTVQRIEVYPAEGAETDPCIMVIYTHVFDDSEDTELPITSTKSKVLKRYQPAEEGATPVATDVSGEDQMVQDIATALWT